MLSVHYAPDVSPALVEILEHHARHVGVSLEALEAIGASLDNVEAFIVAAEDGTAHALLEEMQLQPRTDTKVQRARWQAARLFG